MFKLILKSSLSSLSIRKGRTALVIVMIAISLWGLMVMQGVYEGMVEQMISNAIRSDSGELSIFKSRFREEKSIELYIHTEKAIEEYLERVENIRSYSKKISIMGVVSSARYSRNIYIHGVNLQQESEHSQLQNYLIDGDFSFGQRERGAILGYNLAKKLKIEVGKKVVVSTQDSYGDITSIKLKVMGILKTNNMTFDDSGIFMSLEKAKKFLSLNGVTQFSINLEDFSRVDELKKDVKSKFQNLELYDWRELYPALIQSREMMVIFNYISYLIVFIIASIGVFGVMLVSIMERLREFAILRAIGTKFSYIFYMIFFESLLMGLSGFIVGSVLGGGTLYYFSIYGLDLTQFSDALSEFGMDAITFATIKVEYFITAFISVFSATLLSLVGPLRFLRKRTPIEVING